MKELILIFTLITNAGDKYSSGKADTIMAGEGMTIVSTISQDFNNGDTALVYANKKAPKHYLWVNGNRIEIILPTKNKK